MATKNGRQKMSDKIFDKVNKFTKVNGGRWEEEEEEEVGG